MKSLIVHYMNKYPGGRVDSSESGLSVYNASGELCVKLGKTGGGDLIDVSKEYGAKDCHDLSPLPKGARFMKLYKNGNIGKAEEHDERRPVAEAMAKEKGKVPSVFDIDPEGLKDPTLKK